MKLTDLDLNKHYTYADYLRWRFEERIELIRGRIFKMSPAPRTYHQKVSANLFGEIWTHFKSDPCQVFSAPFDVRLPKSPALTEDHEISTVVQPDICVICDVRKLDDRGCLGAPGWVIEVASPGTARKDRREKRALYESAGVREYWIALLEEKEVHVFFVSKSGKYLPAVIYTKEQSVSPRLFPDLAIELRDIFPDMHLAKEPENEGTYIRL